MSGTLGTGGGRLASRKSLQNCGLPAKGRRVMTAEIHQLHGQSPPSLDPMMALVAADMNEVNSVILDRMQSEVPLIPELAGHLIAGGGKRMRPMLTLARSEEHRSELQSLMRISYAVFCLKKKKKNRTR